MTKSKITIISAFALTVFVLILGYVLLGWLPMILFSFGFLGGFILWLLLPVRASFSDIRNPYWLTLVLFVLHKYEERRMNFFPALSELTGIPVPEADSIGAILLYVAAGSWLLIPWLVSKQNQFGYYLTWTFFTSMGVIELAHFVFPFFTNEPYRYFPGMVSVVWLAPAAWWGIYRLSKKENSVQ